METKRFAAWAVAFVLVFSLSLWGAYQAGVQRGIDIEGTRVVKSAFEEYTGTPPPPPTAEQTRRWPFTDKIH